MRLVRNLETSKLLTLSCIVAALTLAFAAGDMIEIEGFLNARTLTKAGKLDFTRRTKSSYKHNIRFTLTQGTQGEVEDTHPFPSGNIALQITVQNGPHKGESVWVLWTKDHPWLKLLDQKGDETEAPASAHTALAKQDGTCILDPKTPDGQQELSTQELNLEMLRKIAEADQTTVMDNSANRMCAYDNPQTENTDGTLRVETGGSGNAGNNSPSLQASTTTPSPVRAPTSVIPVTRTPLPSPLHSLFDAFFKQSSIFYTYHDPNFLTQAPDVQSDPDDTVGKLARSITAGMTDDMQKTRAIHDWVAKNIYYDKENYYAHTYANSPLTALAILNSPDKKTICQGYSALTAALSRAVGIPAKVVEGPIQDVDPKAQTVPQLTCGNPVQHAWNEVLVKGPNGQSRWVTEDTTWDTLWGETYFDPDPRTFSRDHLKCGEEQM